jgi:hypothetical protein
MTLQWLLPSLLAPTGEEGGHQSWWRRLIAPIVADRRRDAHEQVTDPQLPHQNSEQRDLFRVELERRLLGQ